MTSVNLGTFQDGDLLPNTQTTMAKKGQYVKSQGLVDMNKPPEMISSNMKFKEIQFQKLQRLLDGCHPDFDNDHLCSVNNHDLLLEMSTPSADLHLLPETGVENIRTPKSLHAELKRELSKLNTVLKLPDNVLFLANQFIEYLLHNHLVVREPRSILHAFNIALCWRAASFLKYTELDHRESVALASDGLNYECNEAPS
ncbi:Helicase protein MOM1 [Zea mays]|uniref:Helicase protein MOM1 n=1 Tax=Zea mays TaxID=4577 RepID=A0A1D6KTW7_MAIZE|nr:Helicase protein MOM1 [Zea mays]